MHEAPVFRWPTSGNPECLKVTDFDWGPNIRFLSNSGEQKPSLVDPHSSAGRNSWIVICPTDAYVAPHFRHAFLQRANERPDVDVFYTDDIDLSAGPDRSFINIKPDFDRTLLMSQEYIGSTIIVRASAFARLWDTDSRREETEIFDLVLRARAGGFGISHIPQVLFAYPNPSPPSTRDARMSAVMAQLSGRGFEVLPGLTPESIEVRRKFEIFPAVTILISTADPVSQTFLERISEDLAKSGWPPEKINVLLDVSAPNSDDLEAGGLTANSVDFLFHRSACSVNSTARLNELWMAAKTDYVIFLHGTAKLQPGWLPALLTFSADPSVGVSFGLSFQLSAEGAEFATPQQETLRASHVTPLEKLQHESPNVDRKVFATRRSCLERVNGFDVRLDPQLSVLDFCLRLNILASRTVYTPFCCGPEPRTTLAPSHAPQELALFFARWGMRLDLNPSPQLDPGTQALKARKTHRWFDALF